MNLLIISDLHIWGPDDPLYSSLLALLRVRATSGDRVILAGDLFDLFIGSKSIFTQQYASFIQAVAEAIERGVECHYIEGNHDFLMEPAFRGLKGVTVHSHHVSLKIGGKKFYIAHGDTVVGTDYGYLLLRAFFRSPLMRFLVFVFPGKWLQKLGKFSSYQSRARNSKPRKPLKGIEFLRRAYRSHAAELLAQGFDFVVMGHCHDLDEMRFKIGGRSGQYVNVGFPRLHGSFLSWAPGEDRIQRERLPE